MASLTPLMGPHGPPCPAQSGGGSVSTTSGERAGEKENAVLTQLPSEGSPAAEKEGPVMEAVRAAWVECQDQAQGWKTEGLAVTPATTSFENLYSLSTRQVLENIPSQAQRLTSQSSQPG